MSDRVIWIYDAVTTGPGESWRDVLHSRGREGWEAWHIDVNDMNGGYRTIYLKRPDDQVATVPSEESAAPSGWLMDPWIDVKILTKDPSSHSLTVEKAPGGWVVACRRCGLRLTRRYQDAEHAGEVLEIASLLQVSSPRPACSGKSSATNADTAGTAWRISAVNPAASCDDLDCADFLDWIRRVSACAVGNPYHHYGHHHWTHQKADPGSGPGWFIECAQCGWPYPHQRAYSDYRELMRILQVANALESSLSRVSTGTVVGWRR